jgi:hypothetical protein
MGNCSNNNTYDCSTFCANKGNIKTAAGANMSNKVTKAKKRFQKELTYMPHNPAQSCG